MKHPKAPAFPELKRVFTGYLHEDALADGATIENALRLFLEDADSVERERFQREVSRFLEHTAALDFEEVRRLMHRLGARWVPPSRAALIAALRQR